MYAVKNNTRKIYGAKIETWEREIISANILSVEAGTNGYQGGDTGHGSRTYIRISNLASTNMNVEVINDGVEIILGGDTELETIIEAFKFIVKVLKEESEYEHELEYEF